QRDVIQGDRYPDLRDQLEKLTVLRRQIARKTLAGPAPGEGLPAHQQTLERWNSRREQLEQALSGKIPQMRLEEHLRAADCPAVALALPEDAALIEFFRFDVYDFQAVARKVNDDQWERPCKWKPARYLAFVLPARKPDGARMIDLGEAEVIDRLVADFRDA